MQNIGFQSFKNVYLQQDSNSSFVIQVFRSRGVVDENQNNVTDSIMIIENEKNIGYQIVLSNLLRSIIQVRLAN